MSVQNSPPSHETTVEPEELTIRRLARALDFAEGFWLGFVKSNTPAQRRRVVALCKDLLEPLKIRVIEIELTEPATDLLPVLQERLAQEQDTIARRDTHSEEAHAPAGKPKLAIFVYGLEHSVPSTDAHPPLLSSLNLKRELFRQQVPCPLVLCLPDYALTALARQAPDFWAWRSGLYEFAPERELADQSLAEIGDEAIHITGNLSERAKRERLVMLKGLLDDYHQLGNSPRELDVQANILHRIGVIHDWLGEWPEAKRAYEESLAISRGIKNKEGEAVTLHQLGMLAQDMGEYSEARRLYEQGLKIANELGDQSTIALALRQLGRLAQVQGELDEARRLFSESLEIAKKLDEQITIANTLHYLATIAQAQDDLNEARRLYGQSLEIQKMLGNQGGIARIQHNLAVIAHSQGDFVEARRLYDESLEIARELGDLRGNILALHQLAMLAQDQGESDEARRLYEQSLEMARSLGDQAGIARALHNLGILVLIDDNEEEAARLFCEALEILEKIGSPNVEIARRNLARVEK